MVNKPPVGPGKRVSHWAKRKKFQLQHLPHYALGFILTTISRLLNFHPKMGVMLRRSLELGNPTNSIWPKETIPMNSRLLSGGFWNYGFFQFHRNFFFPYWAHRQYNPSDRSFIPRSHNILSMNQTHRNWVAISFPGKPNEVSIDLAGAIMPEIDSYTLEFALLDEGKLRRPHDEVQKIKMISISPSVLELHWQSRIIRIIAKHNGVRIKASGKENILISFRPFNMEGPSFIDKLYFSEGSNKISGDIHGKFKSLPDLVHISNLANGDALAQIKNFTKKSHDEKIYKTRGKKKKKIRHESRCHAGIITGAFLFNSANDLDLTLYDKKLWKIPNDLYEGLDAKDSASFQKSVWKKWFPSMPQARLPHPFHDWFNDATNNLLTLWDYDSVTPGSFTYHHFWIRDAVIMLNSLLYLGGVKPTGKVLERFPDFVKKNGLFVSQAGEWDANGQALWILGRYAHYSKDTKMLQKNKIGIKKMIEWIEKVSEKNGGVMPPGFSAEHLGVSDWYLWDNFWTMGGLNELKDYADITGSHVGHIVEKINHSLHKYLNDYKYYPAALGRKKDAGMIGSISAIYPMAIDHYFNERMKNTLDIIYTNYFVQGGFFQENIHSGINPYLTLQLAQAFLFMGDVERAHSIVKNLSNWAKPLHSFPEAVHPKTGGGCMGDGFHGWAFAEYISYIKNVFLLEMEKEVILGAGVPESWYNKKSFSIDSLHTQSGIISVHYKSGYLSVTGLNVSLEKQLIISLPDNILIDEKKIELISQKVLPHLRFSKGRSFYRLLSIGNKVKVKLKNKSMAKN